MQYGQTKEFMTSIKDWKSLINLYFLNAQQKISSYRLHFNYIVPILQASKCFDRNRSNVDRRTVPRKQQLITGPMYTCFFYDMYDDCVCVFQHTLKCHVCWECIARLLWAFKQRRKKAFRLSNNNHWHSHKKWTSHANQQKSKQSFTLYNPLANLSTDFYHT